MCRNARKESLVLLSFGPEVSVQKTVTPSTGRPISELKVIELLNMDLPHPALVRLQTYNNI